MTTKILGHGLREPQEFWAYLGHGLGVWVFRLSLSNIPTYGYVRVVKSRTILPFYFERVPENLPCAIASMSMSAMFKTLLQG
jgi:hypothetical protein